jgi:hypothetical protein
MSVLGPASFAGDAWGKPSTTTFLSSTGRTTGTATTSGNRTTFRSSTGRTTGTATTSGGRTTFRDATKIPDGATRLLFLGESTTYGVFVKPEEACPAQVATML